MKTTSKLRNRKGLVGTALVTLGLMGMASVPAQAEPRRAPCPANDRAIEYYDDAGWTARQPVAYSAKQTGVYRGVPPRRGFDRTLVRREVFNTRLRAQIVLAEYYEPGHRTKYRAGHRAGYEGRGGRQLVCRVSLRGPDARAVPYRRLESLATRNCARQARIVIN